jgi:hypothetical protein
VYDIGQKPGWINSRDGLVRIRHLHVYDEFDL